MTPPLTPPNEAVSAAFSAELAHLFPGSMDPGPVNLSAHKNQQKNKVVSFARLLRQMLWLMLPWLPKSLPEGLSDGSAPAAGFHGQWAGLGDLPGLPLPAAAASPVHHH